MAGKSIGPESSRPTFHAASSGRRSARLGTTSAAARRACVAPRACLRIWRRLRRSQACCARARAPVENRRVPPRLLGGCGQGRGGGPGVPAAPAILARGGRRCDRGAQVQRRAPAHALRHGRRLGARSRATGCGVRRLRASAHSSSLHGGTLCLWRVRRASTQCAGPRVRACAFARACVLACVRAYPAPPALAHAAAQARAAAGFTAGGAQEVGGDAGLAALAKSVELELAAHAGARPVRFRVQVRALRRAARRGHLRFLDFP